MSDQGNNATGDGNATGANASGAAGNSGAASGVGGAAASGAATATTDWVAALEPDLRAAVETKGYKSPADVAKAYFSLEKTIGLDKVPLPAKDKDGKRDWSKFDFGALGRPEKPVAGEGGYAFRLPEGQAEPSPTDKALQAHMAPLLHKAGLAQWQLDILAEGLNGFGAQALQQGQAAITQSLERATAELKAELGTAFDAKRDLANRALKAAFGDQLEAATRLKLDDGSFLLDHPLMFRALARIGESLHQEDGALPGGKGGSGFASTPDGAKAEIEKIMEEAKSNPKHPYLDPAHPEHVVLQQRVLDLYRVAYPGERKERAA